jgi:hypothetical protein
LLRGTLFFLGFYSSPERYLESLSDSSLSSKFLSRLIDT